MALGPENFSVLKCQIDVDGTVVADGNEVAVDPASSVRIGYQLQVMNDGAWPTTWWGIGLTIYDVTHGKSLGSELWNGQGWQSTTKNGSRSIGMITEPTEIRVGLWANQDHRVGLPPVSEW